MPSENSVAAGACSAVTTLQVQDLQNTATTAPPMSASSVPLPASGEIPKSSSIQSTSSFLPKMRGSHHRILDARQR